MTGRLRKAYLAFRAIPKTLLFNLRYFGLRRGIQMPAIVSHRVILRNLRGSVEIPDELPFASIRLGFGDMGIFDAGRNRSIWDNRGTIRFQGSAVLSHGCRLSVTGELTFGAGFEATAESICCARRITFGRSCLMSWHVLMMDADFHAIEAAGGGVKPIAKEVEIGDHVWICARSTVLKGAVVASGSVIGAASVVSGSR